MSTTTAPPRPRFESWRDVPDGIYATETQLKTMDLPRRPGPPTATVKARGGTPAHNSVPPDFSALRKRLPAGAWGRCSCAGCRLHRRS